MAKEIKLIDVINADWLRNENVMLRIEDSGIPLRTFFIAKLLNRQLPEYKKSDKAKFLLSVLYNVERRTIYTWLQHNFDPSKAYAKRYKNYQDKLPHSANEKFLIQVITKEKQPREIGSVDACIEAIENAVFGKVESNKPELNLKQILDKRTEFLDPKPLKFENVETMESLVVKLCEDYATGLITITEACERHGLTYLQFVEVITTSDHCNNIYQKASRYANMLQNSRQLTLVDNMIIQLLTTGTHVTETTTFEKYIVPGQLEPKWVEKRKQRTVRQLHPNELITLKMLLMKSFIMDATEEGSEFSTMSESELMDYVVKNNQKLQVALSNNPLVNKGNLDS